MDKSHFFTARRWTSPIEKIVGKTPTIYENVLVGHDEPIQTIYVGEKKTIYENVLIGYDEPIDGVYAGEILKIDMAYVGQTLNVSTVNIDVLEVFPT